MADQSHYVYRPLAPGFSLDRWNISDARSRQFPGVARPMPDHVDYRFRNGWIATGDLPCREAWREYVTEREIQFAKPPYTSVYCGFENPRVEFSRFCFLPTVIERWARCRLRSPAQQSIVLKATTCGGMHLWLNGRVVLKHEPYTRNTPCQKSLELPLPPGEQELTVFFDDLHERDTSCFFQIELIRGEGIESGVATSSDPEQLREIEQFMIGLRTEKIFYGEEMIRLTSDNLPSQPVQLTLSSGSQATSLNSPSEQFDPRHHGRETRIMLSREIPFADVLDSSELPSGCPVLQWQCDIADVTLSRTMGVSILCHPHDLRGMSVSERYAFLLQKLLESEQNTPACALIAISQGQWNDRAQKNFRLLTDIVGLREDCADFHILPLLWIAWQYAETLSVESQQLLRTTLLGFRYWLDEPGNDVMWFWSENHVLCFHVAQYLAGSLYPEETFDNSGRTGYQLAENARSRLHRWFDAIDEHGLAEWNSAAYYPIDFRALLTLECNSPDKGIAARASSLVDAILLMVSLHTINGVPVGSQGRAYDKELFAGPATELGAVAALAFGGWWYGGHDTAAAMLALSGHTIPQSLDAMANLPAARALLADYYQGLDNSARLSVWKCADVLLSCVCDHQTGRQGHQQHVVDIQFAAHPSARVWVNHPGELLAWGEGRPSYWSGNGVLPKVAQHESLAILIYDLSKDHNGIDFTHLFCPADVMDQIDESCPGWLFASSEYGYVAVFGSAPLQPVKDGLYAGSEWRLYSVLCAWVLVTGNAEEYRSFNAFKKACVNRQPAFDSLKGKVSLLGKNGTDQLSLAFDGQLCCNGQMLQTRAKGKIPNVRMSTL